MDRIPFDPYDFFGYLASGLLTIVGMQLTLGFPRILGRDLKLVDSAFLILAVYVIGQIIATPAKTLLEDLVVSKILHHPSDNLLRSEPPHVRGILFPGFYKPLPEPVRNKFFERRDQEGIPGSGESLFLALRYKPAVLEDERLLKRLDTFVSKYGFSRNLSFTSLLVGSALLWKGISRYDFEIFTYALAALVISVLLFYRYLKFFRQYSYELFNVYAGGR